MLSSPVAARTRSRRASGTVPRAIRTASTSSSIPRRGAAPETKATDGTSGHGPGFTAAVSLPFEATIVRAGSRPINCAYGADGATSQRNPSRLSRSRSRTAAASASGTTMPSASAWSSVSSWMSTTAGSPYRATGANCLSVRISVEATSGPRRQACQAGPAELLERRGEAGDAPILDDSAAGPGREPVQEVVTTEVAAPAASVALAEDQPGPGHEALEAVEAAGVAPPGSRARYGAMSSWIAGYVYARLASNARSAAAR